MLTKSERRKTGAQYSLGSRSLWHRRESEVVGTGVPAASLLLLRIQFELMGSCRPQVNGAYCDKTKFATWQAPY